MDAGSGHDQGQEHPPADGFPSGRQVLDGGGDGARRPRVSVPAVRPPGAARHGQPRGDPRAIADEVGGEGSILAPPSLWFRLLPPLLPLVRVSSSSSSSFGRRCPPR